MAKLSPDAQAALDVAESLLGSLKIGAKEGRAQFVSTMHAQGRMSHARYSRGQAVFFHDLPDELADFVGPAWESSGLEEVIDGEPTVLIDHDIAMVWTPYWFRRQGELSHVGTNCFNLVKVTSGDGTEPPKGEWGSKECNWVWKITVANDTARQATAEEKARLDEEYARQNRT